MMCSAHEQLPHYDLTTAISTSRGDYRDWYMGRPTIITTHYILLHYSQLQNYHMCLSHCPLKLQDARIEIQDARDHSLHIITMISRYELNKETRHVKFSDARHITCNSHCIIIYMWAQPLHPIRMSFTILTKLIPWSSPVIPVIYFPLLTQQQFHSLSSTRVFPWNHAVYCP